MEYPQAIVSILMLIICVLLGIPVWWNTTKVYRATLPHARIQELQDSPVKMKVKLQIYAAEVLWPEIKNLNAIVEKHKQFEFGVHMSGKIADMSGDKMELDDYCNHLKNVEETSYFTVSILLLENHEEQFRYYCQSSHSFILSTVSENIVEMMASLLRQVLPLDKVLTYKSHDKRKVDVANSLPLSTGYNIDFTLAIADPADGVPSWNIQNSISKYLQPMLNKLDFLGPFHISSQILYFADVGIKPKKIDGYHYYTKSKLPLIMNPLESRLNTYTSTEAGLKFLIYVPPLKYTPLFIKTSKSSSQLNDAFHSPRWGGIQIWNLSQNKTSSVVAIKTEEYMKKFMFQFLVLNGISTEKIFLKKNQNVLDDWQVTRLMILKIFEHLQSSISTLSSLSKLLDEIANIVIRDDIKELIETSIRNIEQTLISIGKGNITLAISSSKIAFENSEKAFFDWSLLSLLYFPDDQKYAIYVPLFLPISLPVFLSVFKAVKWLRAKE